MKLLSLLFKVEVSCTIKGYVTWHCFFLAFPNNSDSVAMSHSQDLNFVEGRNEK